MSKRVIDNRNGSFSIKSNLGAKIERSDVVEPLPAFTTVRRDKWIPCLSMISNCRSKEIFRRIIDAHKRRTRYVGSRTSSFSLNYNFHSSAQEKEIRRPAVVVPVWRDSTPIWLDDLSCASIDVSFRETPTCCNRTPT